MLVVQLELKKIEKSPANPFFFVQRALVALSLCLSNFGETLGVEANREIMDYFHNKTDDFNHSTAFTFTRVSPPLWNIVLLRP